MKKIFCILAVILASADPAMATGMIWTCEGTQSKLEVISGYMSVELWSGTLNMGDEILFDQQQKNPNSQTQEFDLGTFRLLFIPQRDFKQIEFWGEAKAIAVVFRKDSLIAVDTLSCVGK